LQRGLASQGIFVIVFVWLTSDTDSIFFPQRKLIGNSIEYGDKFSAFSKKKNGKFSLVLLNQTVASESDWCLPARPFKNYKKFTN
jgi:hypothetical protein